jgi:hypothetical protein
VTRPAPVSGQSGPITSAPHSCEGGRQKRGMDKPRWYAHPTRQPRWLERRALAHRPRPTSEVPTTLALLGGESDHLGVESDVERRHARRSDIVDQEARRSLSMTAA